MSASLTTRRTDEAGFTLIETLVALALTGLVLSALANITSQWLPNWNRGMDRIQRSEAIGLALQRIGADLAAAEYVPAFAPPDSPAHIRRRQPRRLSAAMRARSPRCAECDPFRDSSLAAIAR